MAVRIRHISRQVRGLSTVVGQLACQVNPYMKSIDTTVLSCKPVKLLYEIELKDTVLFPEGGGQPSDTGKLRIGNREINVISVRRDGLKAIHLVNESLSQGDNVSLEVDWVQRLDHMQQHTGQHLLSAVLDRRDIATLGWSMGKIINYVEIERKLSPDEAQSVQEEINNIILEGLEIQVRVSGEATQEKGVIRVVHIGDFDANPCCGTHLTKTSELGVLSVLHQQGSKGDSSRLYFMAGGRVTGFAKSANESLRRVTAALACQTDEIDSRISKISTQLRETAGMEKYWKGISASNEAEKIKQQLAKQSVVVLHSVKGDLEFFRMIEKELGGITKGTVVLIGGQSKSEGMIVVLGSRVEEISQQVKSCVQNVRGGGKLKWQGKVPMWENGSIEALFKALRKEI